MTDLSSTKKKSFFLGLMGTPYQSELTTTMFRFVKEALAQQHVVTVWTCGYATMLTQSTLVRDSNIFDEGAREPRHNSPTTSEVVKALIDCSNGNLHWYVCDYCMKERGATQQIDDVQVKIPYTFNLYLNDADISMVLGVKS